MALDARKRQRKLQRKRAKQKARNKGLVRQNRHDSALQLQRSGAYPVLHCCAATTLWENGIGSVLLSRMLPSRQVAHAVFLVDNFCLGVKDAYCGVSPYSKYEEQAYHPLVDKYEMENWAPEKARKFVEGAVEYARSLGLPPHADYQRAKLIFGDIDPSLCEEEFEYGHDGMPYFIAGPNDGPERCRLILGMLREHCGEDGFHFTVPLEAGFSIGNDFEPDAVEFDEDEDG